MMGLQPPPPSVFVAIDATDADLSLNMMEPTANSIYLLIDK